jgi:hypothetical protein
VLPVSWGPCVAGVCGCPFLPLSVFLTIIEYATVCFFLTSGGNRINMRDRRGRDDSYIYN